MNTNLFLDCENLIGYLASTVNVVSPNLCVGPSRTKASLSLLSVCTNQLKSVTKTMKFSKMLLYKNEKL